MADSPRIKLARRALLLLVAVAVVVGGVFAARHSYKVMSVASAYYAKTLCSSLFLSKREERRAVSEDVLADMTVGLRHWHREVYPEQNLVEVNVLGLANREAVYRQGLGCTLALDTTPDALRDQVRSYVAPLPARNPGALWPDGDRVETTTSVEGVDRLILKGAIDQAFEEPNPKRFPRRTQAVVVVHKGRIIAERYADGITADMPRPGWSMGKTVMGALTGILVREGKIKLEQNALFSEWRDVGDPRRQITVEHLLRMVSGLDFDAPHTRMLSDVRKMLFLRSDSAAYVKSEELVDPIGTQFYYASGTTTLLAQLMRDVTDGGLAEYLSFPWKKLFEPIGMTTAVIEPDANGTFLAPAFTFASARDWARFGQFYLQDGVWNGQRILPEGWVGMQRTLTPNSGGVYGAHLWLKIPAFLRPYYVEDHPLPEDSFFMLGHDGQMVAVIPSHELVVVRLGLSRRRNAWDHEALLHDVLKAFSGKEIVGSRGAAGSRSGRNTQRYSIYGG